MIDHAGLTDRLTDLLACLALCCCERKELLETSLASSTAADSKAEGLSRRSSVCCCYCAAGACNCEFVSVRRLWSRGRPAKGGR